MMNAQLTSAADVEARCLELGFLPFFRCGIPGFSIEEMIAPDYWFTDEEGAWEWKGPVIREGHCAYGKFFNRKAGYISRAWLPDWANYRRSRTLAPDEDAAALDDVVLQTIQIEGTATIRELRRLLGFARGRSRGSHGSHGSGGSRRTLPGRHASGRDAVAEDGLLPMEDPADEETKISLDPILTRLQMEMRLVIADFEYNVDRHGNRYGWGVARYTTPEALYGPLTVDRTPSESFERLLNHFRELFPDVPESRLMRLIG